MKWASSNIKKSRAGFTLVELMIVIALIGVLMTLVASATMSIISGQRERVTELTVKKTSGQLERVWKAVIDDANSEKIPDEVMTLALQDRERARTIYTKLRLMQEFPMGYYEALNGPGYGVGARQSYVRSLNTAGITTGLEPAGTTEPAACLLMAITAKGRRGVSIDADSYSSSEIRDTNGDGMPELVDAWGSPVSFFRFPTGDGGPADPNGPFASKPDPLDPAQKLSVTTWWSSYRDQYEAACRHSITNSGGTGPQSFYCIPVVASAGKDGVWGLDFSTPSGTAWRSRMMWLDTSTGSNDNIYSFRITK